METDEKILDILRRNPDDYVSGEELCRSAGVSRAAIWKRIERLREEGYDIEAVPHLGYRLSGIPGSLIPGEIRWSLRAAVFGSGVISYKKVGSTNTVAYELAEKGLKEGTVVTAEAQESGRGRQGRSWQSPQGSGIYMSCILRPVMTPNEIPKITLVAAVAVAKAIRAFTGLEAMIKWPNDILVGGKKVCGILTEMKAEQDRIDFVILGIGINVNTPLKLLPAGASSLREELKISGPAIKLSRIELARKVLEELDAHYIILKKYGAGNIIDQWKGLSGFLGSRVKIVTAKRTIEGIAHDIDPDGALVLRLDAGILHKVSSGDVVMAR